MDNILLSPKEAHLNFIQQFGNTRSYEAVRKQMKRLREVVVEGEEEILPSFLEENVTPLDLLQTDPALIKQNATLWLKSINELHLEQKPVVQPGIWSSNASLVIMISDVHWGKKTDSGFCSDVAVERVLSIPEKIVSILGKDPTDLDIDEVVVLFLGDELEGEDIFDGQNAMIELPVILQSKVATVTFWKLLNALSVIFEVPVRVETVPGNHGRMSKTANKASNWDNSVYQTLSILASMDDTEDIIVNANLEAFNIIDIKGHKIYLNHQGVKHMGTPAMKVKFAGWIISKDIEYLLSGHWHRIEVSSFIGRRTICNGSICGPDDLSEQMAVEEPPAQVFFLMKPGKKIDNIHIINF